MRTSESVKNISEALCKFQGKISSVKKDSENPFFNSTYADLESIVSHVRKELFDYGLSVVQLVEGKSLVTRLCHVSGEWIEGSADLAIKNQNNVQDVYASVTYFRRMAYTGGLGIVCTDEDDDGNRCKPDSEHEVKPKEQAQAVTKPEPKKQEQKPKVSAPAEPTQEQINDPPNPDKLVKQGVLKDVEEKQGTNKKTNKPWTRYGIILESGDMFGTFDTKLAETAISLIGEEVEIEWKHEGKFNTAVSISPIIRPVVQQDGSLPF